jgi:hypothetical protein
MGDIGGVEIYPLFLSDIMTDITVIREAVTKGLAIIYERRRLRIKPRRRRKKNLHILRKIKKRSTGPSLWRSEMMQHIADRMI